MKLLGRLALLTASAALVSTPVLAAPANPAASLSVAKSARAATPAQGEQARGGIFIAAAAAVVVIVAIILIADDNGGGGRSR